MLGHAEYCGFSCNLTTFGYLYGVRRRQVTFPLSCEISLFSVLTRRQGGHVDVQNNNVKGFSGISFYYYAKLERHFAVVLYTNMAASSRG